MLAKPFCFRWCVGGVKRSSTSVMIDKWFFDKFYESIGLFIDLFCLAFHPWSEKSGIYKLLWITCLLWITDWYETSMSADQTDKIYVETSLRVPIEFVVIYVEIFSLEWVVVDVEKLTWSVDFINFITFIN